jgi:hypothetical protein
LKIDDTDETLDAAAAMADGKLALAIAAAALLLDDGQSLFGANLGQILEIVEGRFASSPEYSLLLF